MLYYSGIAGRNVNLANYSTANDSLGEGLTQMDIQAFLITFREALEALLIVGIITTYLTRIGEKKWNKWVWLGVVLALVSSYLIALLFQVFLTGFASMKNQVFLKIAIMFISAGLLTHMVIFMSKQSKDMKGHLQSKFNKLLTTGSILNMVVHSFLVVLREGVETVFFFAAISGGDIQKAISSWGALFGVIAAAAVAFFFFNGTKRIPLASFFKGTGMLIMVIAAGLLVQGIGMLQDLGYIGSVYETEGGQIGQVYNITWLMPEHPIDEEHYIRNTGEKPVFSGQVGIFMKAMLGYSQSPSVEEFAGYWLYYLLVFFLVNMSTKSSGKQAIPKVSISSSPIQVRNSADEAI